MIKIKRNPHLEDVEYYIKNNSSFYSKIGEGYEAETFFFKLTKKIILNNEILKPGKYILKLYSSNNRISEEKIKKLKLISKYGLIPKIFVITKTYVVMKYIDGYTLRKVIDLFLESDRDKIDILFDKIENIKDIWFDKLKINDENDPRSQIYIDTDYDNFIVSKDLNHIYVIDPIIYEY